MQTFYLPKPTTSLNGPLKVGRFVGRFREVLLYVYICISFRVPCSGTNHCAVCPQRQPCSSLEPKHLPRKTQSSSHSAARCLRSPSRRRQEVSERRLSYTSISIYTITPVPKNLALSNKRHKISSRFSELYAGYSSGCPR